MKTKYVISGSRLEKFMDEYFDKIFPMGEISWTYPYVDFEDGSEGEDPNVIEFYLGEYGEDNNIFRWYGCDYFKQGSNARDICPELVVEGPYDVQLNSYFGDKWEEPFRKWFVKKFKIPCKTVATI